MSRNISEIYESVRKLAEEACDDEYVFPVEISKLLSRQLRTTAEALDNSVADLEQKLRQTGIEEEVVTSVLQFMSQSQSRAVRNLIRLSVGLEDVQLKTKNDPSEPTPERFGIIAAIESAEMMTQK